MRRNPILARLPRRSPISGIPGSVPWILLAMVAPAIVLMLARLPGPPPVKAAPPPPPQVEARIDASGFDKMHRRLPFTIYVLTQQFSWKLESTSGLEGERTLLNPELTAAVNRAREVFCVGTASFEGATRAEEARASQRSGQLAEWVRAALVDPGKTRLFQLNAGQYVGPRELQSSYQRKAIIIAAGPHDDDVDLGEALRSGLEQQQSSAVIYSLLHHYSRSNRWLKSF